MLWSASEQRVGGQPIRARSARLGVATRPSAATLAARALLRSGGSMRAAASLVFHIARIKNKIPNVIPQVIFHAIILEKYCEHT